jgi:hypothetical protein
MRDLGIDEEEYRARVDKHMQGLAGPAEVPESRGRASHERMHKGDVVLPKATYSDYLEIYKSSRNLQEQCNWRHRRRRRCRAYGSSTTEER